MWSTLLLPLLLLHFIYMHAALAMATASGGLTVIEGASTSSSTSSTTTSTTSTTSATSSMALSTATAVAASGQRKRHRKRNSSWYDYRNYNENTTALEWMNPCGGSYYTSSATERRRAQRPKQIFNQLKRAAGTEYRELNSTQEHKGIDIGDMQVWSLHKYNYKFLPKLKPNSTIALKRWYRNMQTYVASFAYLRRVQVNWDRQYLKRESSVAKELKKLLLSSRSMLCELETAVNRTYPAPVAAPGRGAAKQRRLMQLPQISRNDMNRRLKLRSKRRPGAAAETTTEAASAASAEAATTIGEADSMDMRFVKHHYYEFLRTMWQLLRRDSKRERQQRRQRRQRRQQRQRQQQSPLQQQQHQQRQRQRQWQQQQQLQQPRLQLSLAMAGNRREFNEVSKPQLDVPRGVNGRRGKRQQPPPSASATASTSASASASTSTSAAAAAAAAAANQRQQRRVLRT
ncbi:uncharacterized protein upd1 isoform X2 [Drosophila virilis]|uniref:Uncharacterized protein, isoform A n=2 Tax=Drosophila virilis TaxID=7244 RepID=B4M3B8_DROVI|nr:trichohyalin isoform X2 [Drosophila virilis]EDW65293.1 uncharacterized protein Dvir_GJ18988, isoform A [Drosophila virilis]KRF82167.1 uncharacterized protein Dvir_GJ18988, isoform B [Drosophila virilis]